MPENAVCSLFGIRYPLLMGGITPRAELGAVVSNAGGLGCIEGIESADRLRGQIRRFRELSDRPFSVNLPIAFGKPEATQARVEVIIEERVPAVVTSAGSPKLLTGTLQEHGVKVAHVIAGLAHARKAAEAGVDALVAEPTESGGYRGANEISMMVLIPAVRRAVPGLPLVAAGSVADRAGLVAIFALGADGVQLGTRLVATREARDHYPDFAHPLILAADDTSTMSARGRTRPRVSRPEFAEAVLGTRRKRMQMGQVAALIDDVPGVAEVFEELFEGGRERAGAVSDSLARIVEAQ